MRGDGDEERGMKNEKKEEWRREDVEKRENEGER